MASEDTQKNYGPWIYKLDTKGKTRKWRYVVEGDAFYSQQGIAEPEAKLTTNKPTLCTPKNVGRSNASTAEEQALVEAEARMEKKLKTGYFHDRAEIAGKFQSPMLAKNYADRLGKIKFPVGIELKLNGVRAVYRTRGVLLSRNNKRFHTVPHILEVLDTRLPEGIQLDGELFNPDNRENLNRTTKLANVTRTEPTTEDLAESRRIVQYHIFDAYGFTDKLTGKEITPETPFALRRLALLGLVEQLERNTGALPGIRCVRHRVCNSDEEVMQAFRDFVADGHEGGIVRLLDAPYEFKKSANLLKVKDFQDAEFEIVELQEGKGNWAGYVKRVICKLSPELLRIAQTKNPDAKTTFAANIRGDREHLLALWNTRKAQVGRMATVTYQDISEYGYPQLGYVGAIRDYE